MKTFNIRTLEKWEMMVEYTVEADTVDDAKKLIESGKVGIENSENTFYDEVIDYLLIEEDQ